MVIVRVCVIASLALLLLSFSNSSPLGLENIGYQNQQRSVDDDQGIAEGLGPDTPGGKYWSDLVNSLPVIKDELEKLNDCVSIVDRYQVIQQHFYYVEGDEQSLENSQIALCRLALILNSDIQREISSEEVSHPGTADSERDSTNQLYNRYTNSKRAYDSIGAGPLDLKRAYDSIGAGPLDLKRAYDSIGAGPLDLKRAYDSIGAGPLDLKRAYNYRKTGVEGLKRAYDSIGAGPLDLKRSEKPEMDTAEEEGVTNDDENNSKQMLIKQLESELSERYNTFNK